MHLLDLRFVVRNVLVVVCSIEALLESSAKIAYGLSMLYAWIAPGNKRSRPLSSKRTLQDPRDHGRDITPLENTLQS